MATTTTLIVPATEKNASSILPDFVGETFGALNTLARTCHKVLKGVERAVDGCDEIATIMLSQQKERLLKEML